LPLPSNKNATFATFYTSAGLLYSANKKQHIISKASLKPMYSQGKPKSMVNMLYNS